MFNFHKMFLLSKPTFLCMRPLSAAGQGEGTAAWEWLFWGWLLFKLQVFCIKWKVCFSLAPEWIEVRGLGEGEFRARELTVLWETETLPLQCCVLCT